MTSSTPWGNRKVLDETADEWQAIQKKTFTRWCNSHLKARSVAIEDLFADVNDGTVLLHLLEVIGGDTIKSICGRNFYAPAKCKMDIHKLENCNLIFDYLKAKELKLVNIGSSDIKDGSPRLVLGLIWTIILRFAISEDGKEGLLLWCRKNTSGYDSVDVQNFSRSWQDGLAFCALIHHFRPDLIDFQACLANREEPMTNLNLAFDIAKDQLDIDRLLDAEDICGNAKPDEKSIIAYLSLFFQKFAALAQKDNLADAIKKAVSTTQHHESSIKDYDENASSLLSWIRVQHGKFSSVEDLNAAYSTTAVVALIESSHSFKNNDKPPKQQQLASCETLLANLRLSQRNNERPLYAPEIEVEDLETEWAALDKAEQGFEDSSVALLDAFEHTDYALQRFTNKIVKIEDFCASSSPLFSSAPGASVAECQALLKKCVAFEAQQPKYATMLASCGEFVELCHAQHEGAAAAAARYEAAVSSMADLTAAEAEYKKRVEDALAEQVRLLAVKEDYEVALSNFEFELFEHQEALLEPISLCNSVAAIEVVIKKTEAVKTALQSSEATLVELEGVSTELAACSYPVDKDVSTARDLFTDLTSSLTERFGKLEAAHASQATKAKIKESFATSCSKLMDYCAETSRVTASLTRRMSITAEKQAEKLENLMEGFANDGSALMDAVEGANDAQLAAEIFVNSLTTHTVFSCRLVYTECEKNLKSAIEINAAHILALNGQSEMSAEQAREIREAFDNFDKDKSGKLSLKEFQDGLMAMGIVLSDDDSATEFKKRDLDGSETLSFDEFATYILEQFQSGSSEADILSAFKGLVDGKPIITGNEIAQWFPDHGEYMNERMADGEGGKNYEGFVAEIFKV
ncbi:hypothetical protein TrRE_jg4983 [Triparma retinervis]|uniref:Calmodulin n=1 Tax=Triparma retinervis TaxID=2557542 RepID=A0A9W7A5G4_9STRA|nr:hypothetical protein TrRE_jg4983 [Triparma retinervis]